MASRKWSSIVTKHCEIIELYAVSYIRFLINI